MSYLAYLASSLPPDDFATTPTLKMEFGTPLDESGNFTTMLINNPTRSTTAKKFGVAGFTGENPNVTAVQLSSNLDLGAGDWTIECWVQASAEPSTLGYIIGRWATAGNRCYQAFYDPTLNQWTMNCTSDGSTTVNSVYDFDTDGAMTPATFFNGTMRHVAFVNDGGTFRTYVEGVAGSNTGVLSGAVFNGGTQNTYVLASGGTSVNPASGWRNSVDELRVTIGTARYTSNFTPPSVQFGRNSTDDANWANVKLLLGFENYFGGVRGGTSAALNVVVPNSVSTDRYDPNGIQGIASITWPYVPYIASDFDLGSGDFTVEVFGARLVGASWSTASSGAGVLGCFSGTAGQMCWQWCIAATGNFAFRYSTNGTAIAATVSTGTVGSADTDYNLAAVRKGNDLYLYVNGSKVATASVTGVTIYSPGGASVPLGVLSGMTVALSNYLTCPAEAHMKAFRITKATARYQNASYAVPTLPLP